MFYGLSTMVFVMSDSVSHIKDNIPTFTAYNANVLDPASNLTIEQKSLTFDAGSLISIDDQASDFGSSHISVDLTEKFVMPAFVDLHLHPAPIADPIFNCLSDQPPTGRYGPVGPELVHSNLREAFRSGVMYAKDMGTPEDALSQLDLYRDDRYYPHIDSCVRPITGVDGHLSTIGYEVETRDDVSNAISELTDAGATHVKIVKDKSLDDELFYSVVDISQEQGLYVSCHAYATEEVAAAIQAGCDSIEHALPPTHELAELAISNETIFVPTVYCSQTTSLPRELTDISDENHSIFEKWREELYENSNVAIHTDVNIGIGTDAGMPPIGFGNYVKEIRCLAELGFSIEQLLQSATISGAAQVGMIDDWTIAENTSPYLIVLDGDPRDDLRYLESARPLVFQGIPIFDYLHEFIEYS